MIGPTIRVRSIAKPVSRNMLAICAGAKSWIVAVRHQSDNDKRAHYPPATVRDPGSWLQAPDEGS